MKFSSLASAVALAVSSASAVTVYLAGDSTMATASGVITGWGQYFPYSAKSGITVLNKAIGGRSARSYTREGRFQEIINAVQSGDYVVIEFGHNDGGSLSTDNGRTDCSGNGTETCTTVYDGVTETVLTFPAYLQNAGSAMMAKGAKVIMSSQTPNNPWESGTFSYSDSRFVTYAQLAAQRIGATYIDHGRYVANRFQALGLTTTNSYFPQDHTHTSPKGADVVQAAFVKAVLCACNPLAAVIKNSTARLDWLHDLRSRDDLHLLQ
ncbi:SGNH hydrolase-type esterase domain-containing protein [Auriculariales sp. MPI-PUGE-AT-0066]|nr:SGNH hydrolase-type esterase domain-containing protein [Auriculariales sp. MPI-PUGE-AT-0066]